MSTVATHPTYEERAAGFDWAISETELGVSREGRINIGWHCSDRICRAGAGRKPALIWEDSAGRRPHLHLRRPPRALQHHRRASSSASACSPASASACSWTASPSSTSASSASSRWAPSSQPLFSAFGEESLLHAPRERADRGDHHPEKHVAKVRKIRDRLPALQARHRRGRRQDAPLQPGEIALALDSLPRVEPFEVYPFDRPRRPSVLHYTSGTTGQPKGAQHVHYSLISQYLTAKWVLDLQAGRHLLVQRRPRLGDRHLLRHHRPVGERRHAGRARLRLQRRALVRVHRRSTASRSGTRRPPPSAC